MAFLWSSRAFCRSTTVPPGPPKIAYRESIAKIVLARVKDAVQNRDLQTFIGAIYKLQSDPGVSVVAPRRRYLWVYGAPFWGWDMEPLRGPLKHSHHVGSCFSLSLSLLPCALHHKISHFYRVLRNSWSRFMARSKREGWYDKSHKISLNYLMGILFSVQSRLHPKKREKTRNKRQDSHQVNWKREHWTVYLVEPADRFV